MSVEKDPEAGSAAAAGDAFVTNPPQVRAAAARPVRRRRMVRYSCEEVGGAAGTYRW
jgi:hypothetical protein